MCNTDMNLSDRPSTDSLAQAGLFISFLDSPVQNGNWFSREVQSVPIWGISNRNRWEKKLQKTKEWKPPCRNLGSSFGPGRSFGRSPQTFRRRWPTGPLTLARTFWWNVYRAWSLLCWAFHASLSIHPPALSSHPVRKGWEFTTTTNNPQNNQTTTKQNKPTKPIKPTQPNQTKSNQNKKQKTFVLRQLGIFKIKSLSFRLVGFGVRWFRERFGMLNFCFQKKKTAVPSGFYNAIIRPKRGPFAWILRPLLGRIIKQRFSFRS